MQLGGNSSIKVIASSHFGANSFGDRFLSIPGFDGNPMVHIETGNHKIYCSNKNGGQSINAPTPEEIAQEAADINAGRIVYTYQNECAKYAYNGPSSMTYWEPEGGTEAALPDLAYIITYPGGEDLKQYAIWRRDGNAKGDGISNNRRGNGDELFANKALLKQADALLKEADTYAEYGEKIEQNIKKDPNNALGLENTTDPTQLSVLSENGEYVTIGPLSMTYTDGRTDSITFGGIHDMWIEGYNVNGDKIVDKIEITSFILADDSSTSSNIQGTEIEPKFFNPNTSDKTYIDEEEQLYPESGQKFYLKFKNPNYGNTGSISSRVKTVGIKVEFQYMRAEATIQRMHGKHDKIYYASCEHEEFEDGSFICTMTRVKIGIDDKAAQDTFEAIGNRYLYSQIITLVGETPDEGGPPDEGNPPDGIDLTMKLGGYVWEDGKQGKETLADGRISGSKSEGIYSIEKPDRALPNVKVTLYEYDPASNKSKQAELMTSVGDSGGEILHNINSTITDENGYYQFNGLDISKKYYVRFDYNGQIYMPTDYLKGGGSSVEAMVNAGLYNTDTWYTTSKALEETSLRDSFDAKFQEIASYPNNYTSSNSLGVGSKNAVFTMLELMGYELDSNGQYSQTKTQLVDGFKYDSKGLKTDEFAEGEISKRIKSFIESNKAYPNESQMKSIYNQIAGGDKETLRKLQFIEDCYIYAYTSHGQGTPSEYDLYPPFDNIVVHEISEQKGSDSSANYAQVYDGWVATNDVQMSVRSGSTQKSSGSTEYKSVYDGQFYINCGLWRRQEFDMALRKDVYKAALKINGKTMVYDYEQRNMDSDSGVGQNNSNGQDNNTYWDINVRLQNYDQYYKQSYNDSGTPGYIRELYQADYDYNSKNLNHPGSDLEVYITYKITIRNQSMSIEGQIKEVVDYFDGDYTFKPNLSWVMFQQGNNFSGYVDENEYYNMMAQEQSIIDNDGTSQIGNITGAQSANATVGKSRYGNEGTLQGYNSVYITGLDGKNLQTGESAYIYLTFQVNKEGEKVKVDTGDSAKENIAEINGYSTYYRDGTQLPNGVTKGSGDIAGLLDRDSNPGNVDDDLQGVNLETEEYEKYFEDDTDRAPSLRITVNQDAIRKANGIVWEDNRTETQQEAVIGNGIKENNEIGISGVTVQFVEKREDGQEYIWFEETSNENGQYEIAGYIPGDYVIRFKYGDTYKTVLTTNSEGNQKGENATSYNGQDFKSTLYQSSLNNGQVSGLPQNANTDSGGKYHGYTNTETQNESGKYGYDIYAADSNSTNYSDAKDLWKTDEWENSTNGKIFVMNGNSFQSATNYILHGRQEVIDYSTTEVTNHKAEVLASPYEVPEYNNTKYTAEEMQALYDELMRETQMTAETGVIVVEVEYNRQQTGHDQAKDDAPVVGEDNKKNGNYTLANIDLGLTERPKAQLEIDKSITNVNLTLANQTVLFDINKRANNALWKDHEEYKIEDEKGKGIYNNYYGKQNHRYEFRKDIDNIIITKDKGLIQLTMDEELMHGSTITITYEIKITNVGEVDYVDDQTKDFYYRGEVSGTTIATTSADQIVDCVQNNLQYVAKNKINQDNKWDLISTDEILKETDSAWLINKKLAEKIKGFNTIIDAGIDNGEEKKELVPYNGSNEDESTQYKTLVLSQMITPENTDDDLTYTNMIEIVKTSNTAGRRMAFSVVGNQDPTLENASEIDASAAEKVIILPPFGKETIYYVLIGTVGLILVAGITLIIRKVLKKK